MKYFNGQLRLNVGAKVQSRFSGEIRKVVEVVSLPDGFTTYIVTNNNGRFYWTDPLFEYTWDVVSNGQKEIPEDKEYMEAFE